MQYPNNQTYQGTPVKTKVSPQMGATASAGLGRLSHDAGSAAGPAGEATSTQSRSGRGSGRPPSSSGVGAFRLRAPRTVSVSVPLRPLWKPPAVLLLLVLLVLARRALVGEGVEGAEEDGGTMAAGMWTSSSAAK